MGLLDVLKGMQNGPHGQPQSGSSGGMALSFTELAYAQELEFGCSREA